MKTRTKIFRAAAALLAALLIGAAGLLPAAAEGTLAVTASASTVTVGSKVTVTMKFSGKDKGLGAIDAQLSYNAEAFRFDKAEADGGSANGGAGVVRFSWFARSTQAPSTVTLSATFTAIKAGAGDFTVSTGTFTDFDENTLGTPSGTAAVSATDPTLSANADLSALKPSSGTLTPRFSANTTSYTVTVPYTTTSLTLSATAAQIGAKVSISGKNTLTVGKNTRVITVTAPSGATKKYTVTITREAGQTAASGSTQTTLPAVPDDALEVSIDGRLLTVADTQPDTELPDGYEWSSVVINRVTVPAAKGAQSGLTLLWLLDPAAPGENGKPTGAFYLFEATSGDFTPFCPVTVSGGLYAVLPMPAGLDAPAGTVAGKCRIGEAEYDAWMYEDTALADLYLLYVTAPNGKTGLYTYDAADGSFQRYREIVLPAAPDTSDPTEPTQPAGGFAAFMEGHRTALLLAAAVIGAVALLIAAIVLLARAGRRRPTGKH